MTAFTEIFADITPYTLKEKLGVLKAGVNGVGILRALFTLPESADADWRCVNCAGEGAAAFTLAVFPQEISFSVNCVGREGAPFTLGVLTPGFSLGVNWDGPLNALFIPRGSFRRFPQRVNCEWVAARRLYSPLTYV